MNIECRLIASVYSICVPTVTPVEYNTPFILDHFTRKTARLTTDEKNRFETHKKLYIYISGVSASLMQTRNGGVLGIAETAIELAVMSDSRSSFRAVTDRFLIRVSIKVNENEDTLSIQILSDVVCS